MSASTISRLERGHLDAVPLRTLRAIAGALDVRVDIVARWRAGDLDRLLNARHSALHELVARIFRDRLPDWVIEPEVSFAIFRERGVIDILAWHPGRRALLVIELKTDIVDVNDLVGSVDRKRRLARQVAATRGWRPATVSAWVIVVGGRTNRARVAAHGAMLRAAYPTDGRGIGRWLRDPAGSVAALSMWPGSNAETGMPTLRPIRRVRRRSARRRRGRCAGPGGGTAASRHNDHGVTAMSGFGPRSALLTGVRSASVRGPGLHRVGGRRTSTIAVTGRESCHAGARH